MAVDGSTALLTARGLGFAYPGQAALLSDASLAIGPGVTFVHGDTGSGKTTLLRVLAGELAASGRLTLGGVHFDQDPARYRRQVSVGNPASDAFDQFTARACTAFLSEGDAGFDAVEWQNLVDGFALLPHLEKPLYMLSTGSRRKVWLAAALASGRALILLDEPGGALDAASVRCLRAALGRRTQRPGSAVVVASAERLDGIAFAGTIELPQR